LPALAGANLIYGLGMIEMGMTIDYGQLVMDNEFARMIKNTIQGIPVNDKTLAVDIIKEIGHFGEFLSHESTYQQMRTLSQTKIIDRRMRDAWEIDGKVDIYQRSLEKARYILTHHKPEPLPQDVSNTIREIVKEAEEELGVSGGE
jgi:trimethylamine--corrinoid protein Co-methyltransferase